MARQVEEPVIDVETKLARWEQQFEENKKSYTLIGGIIVLVVLLYFGWVKLYLAPREQEAQEALFMAEKYFEQDSLEQAMYGAAGYPGFKQIIDDYGFTSAGNLANYYMGVSLLRKGEFAAAVDYLQEFDADDEIIGPVAEGALGDAHAEMGNTDQAVEHYLSAATMKENEFTTPIYYLRAGILLEQAGKYKEAIDAYEKIRANYPESSEGRDIEKYIVRAQTILEGK